MPEPIKPSEEYLDELLVTAMQHFPDAMELAISTNDEELFHKTMEAANKILVSDTLSGLIEKGLIEMAEVNEDGDFYFSLTKEGRKVARKYDEPED